MIRTNFNYIAFSTMLIFCIFFMQCRKTAFGDFRLTSGSADFSKFISVGNSLTQGYQDEGLYESTQQYSYPSLIAQQMKFVNDSMGDFKQAIAAGSGSGYSHLEYIDSNLVVVRSGDPDYGDGYGASSTWSSFSNYSSQEINNMGVSGIRLRDCIGLNPTELIVNYYTLTANPFGGYLDWGSDPLFAGDPNEYVELVREADHSFFTCWMGNNDVLGIATNGGVEESINVLGLDIAVYQFTEISEFREKYDSLLASLTSEGAKGVCATLPNIMSIPYFSTITPSSFDKDVWIETGTGDIRRAIDGDLLLLSTKSVIEGLNGTSSTEPAPNTSVIDVAEAAEISSYVIAYNEQIKASAEKYNVPVVDMYRFFESFPDGITVDGVTLTQKYIEGGAMSLDGIHPNPRGHALIANEFIKAINDYYFSTIPLVSVGEYPGIMFPN